MRSELAAVNFVYLPGLDGSAILREHFASRATIVSYPPSEILTFDDYVAIARDHVGEDSVVIGESFSGPIAIRIASERPVAGLVLVSSFAKAPFPRFLGRIPLRFNELAAFWMVGTNAEERRKLRSAINTVEPRVLASRLRIALEVDERASLARTTMPLLDIRASRDVLNHSRRAILAARPDAATAEIAGPHGLLLAEPTKTWKVITSWSATIPASRRPSAEIQ